MPEVSSKDVAFARACREKVQALHPPLVDLYEGFGSTGRFEPDRFLVYFFARRQGLLRGCTNFVAQPGVTADGRPWIGRNYDWAYSDARWCEVRQIAAEGEPALLSYTHHWIGHPDCLSEAGLFIAISSLPPAEAEEPGVQWNLLVDAIAARCRRVDEAVDLLTGQTHLRAITYLLADATGDAAAVEGGPGGCTVRRPAGGILIATNHRVGEADGSARTRHSVDRYERAAQLLSAERGRIDETAVRGVLRDPVCTIRNGVRTRHRIDHVEVGAKTDWGTIWSTLCRPDRLELKIAPGHPTECDYERVAFEGRRKGKGKGQG